MGVEEIVEEKGEMVVEEEEEDGGVDDGSDDDDDHDGDDGDDVVSWQGPKLLLQSPLVPKFLLRQLQHYSRLMRVK